MQRNFYFELKKWKGLKDQRLIVKWISRTIDQNKLESKKKIRLKS